MLARSGIDVVRLEREAGRMITEGVPVWAFQVLLPLGFAVLAWRIVRTTYKSHPAAGVGGGRRRAARPLSRRRAALQLEPIRSRR